MEHDLFYIFIFIITGKFHNVCGGRVRSLMAAFVLGRLQWKLDD